MVFAQKKKRPKGMRSNWLSFITFGRALCWWMGDAGQVEEGVSSSRSRTTPKKIE